MALGKRLIVHHSTCTHKKKEEEKISYSKVVKAENVVYSLTVSSVFPTAAVCKTIKNAPLLSLLSRINVRKANYERPMDFLSDCYYTKKKDEKS